MADEIKIMTKYAASDQDKVANEKDSIRQGVLEGVQLKERFGLISTIGLYFSLGAAPLSIGSYMTVISGAGGGAFLFWGTLVAFFFQMLVCLSLAEVSSAFPHTIGEFLPAC